MFQNMPFFLIFFFLYQQITAQCVFVCVFCVCNLHGLRCRAWTVKKNLRYCQQFAGEPVWLHRCCVAVKCRCYFIGRYITFWLAEIILLSRASMCADRPSSLFSRCVHNILNVKPFYSLSFSSQLKKKKNACFIFPSTSRSL